MARAPASVVTVRTYIWSYSSTDSLTMLDSPFFEDRHHILWRGLELEVA
ncbi:MAG: hypothetical protein J4G06_05555 [Caldilineaceae bacterium]|nr:hypothetical protein [Caldilineaceae bacterium]